MACFSPIPRLTAWLPRSDGVDPSEFSSEFRKLEGLTILGIIVSHTLTFHHHVSALVTKCSRSFYAPKTTRAHGLNGSTLWDITRATLVSQLQYACPAWWGYLKADERSRLQSIVSKAIRNCFLPRSFCTLDELREDADEQLISSRYNPNHVLHRLLPSPKELTTICANVPTTLLYLRTATLLWNIIFL